jgi:hypothetical protein
MADRYEYGRFGNPTIAAAEARLAALDCAEAVVQLASGMAALACTFLKFLPAGSHIVMTDDSYRGTRQLCEEHLRPFNVGCTVVALGAYPRGNRGVYEITGLANDMGRFRPPTLRNVELTATYMHDGSLATLEDVIRHYAAGGREITEGPNQGDGRRNPFKSPLVAGFTMTDQEVDDLAHFLRSLTDRDFTTAPSISSCATALTRMCSCCPSAARLPTRWNCTRL